MMKKIIIFFVVFLLLMIIWFGESRKFYCLENGNCITVWKTYNNVCYIIPGKYYGPVKPSGNFITSTNTNGLTLYFTNEMPGTWIFQSEQPLKIDSSDKAGVAFLDYTKDDIRYKNILYKPDAKAKFMDLKDNATLISLDIKENYAMGKYGKKL